MRRLRVGCVISALCFGSMSFAGNTNTRVTNPNAFTVEMGGRGLLWSLNYDRVLHENLVAGLGFGTAPTNLPGGSSSGQSALLLPVYLSYYFFKDAGSLYATVGASVALNSGSISGQSSTIGGIQFSSTPLVPTFGVGYEYRSDPGFLVRLTAYGMIGGNFIPWGGLAFGYSF